MSFLPQITQKIIYFYIVCIIRIRTVEITLQEKNKIRMLFPLYHNVIHKRSLGLYNHEIETNKQNIYNAAKAKANNGSSSKSFKNRFYRYIKNKMKGYNISMSQLINGVKPKLLNAHKTKHLYDIRFRLIDPLKHVFDPSS